MSIQEGVIIDKFHDRAANLGSDNFSRSAAIMVPHRAQPRLAMSALATGNTTAEVN